MQTALFHERFEDALDEVMRCCGGRKKVAIELWGKVKSERDAHNLMDACLNPERRERFSPEQVLYILKRGREVGCHAAMHYLNSEAGYAPAQPIEPEDEIAKLQREFIESVKEQGRRAERIEALMAARPTALRQVG